MFNRIKHVIAKRSFLIAFNACALAMLLTFGVLDLDGRFSWLIWLCTGFQLAMLIFSIWRERYLRAYQAELERVGAQYRTEFMAELNEKLDTGIAQFKSECDKAAIDMEEINLERRTKH